MHIACYVFIYVNKDIIYILGQEQAGLRKGYSTMNHVFVLHVVIELFKNGVIVFLFIIGKPSIQLKHKLLSYGINGKMFIVIKDIYIIYDKAKSCLMKDNKKSEYVMCSMGV